MKIVNLRMEKVEVNLFG